MDCSPSRSKLYRRAYWLVISAVLGLISSCLGAAQVSRSKVNKAPRAIGLIELLPGGGKARLIPVAIRVDGEFYDASAYKASPVPMAIWSEVVYEGFRTGVSQGLFTVIDALQNERTKEWLGEGNWQTTEQLAAKLKKKSAPVQPRGLEDDEGPPVLRHSGAKQPTPPEPAAAKPAEPPAPATPPAPAAPTAATPAATPALEPEDKDHPSLKRGKPAAKPEEPVEQPAVAPSSPPSHSVVAPKPQFELIPAVSDQVPSESRSYAYDLKPEEQAQLRNKMLALAADEINAKAFQPGKPTSSARPKHKKPEVVEPKFEDVQLRIFDLSSTNEPLLVLTATSQVPQTPVENQTRPDLKYTITLIEREDVNAEFHKVLSNVTDPDHLDVVHRFELIDAVDADGDGRGELLFRQVSDAGSAFVIYRVIGDRLYALFEGKIL